MPVNVPSRSRTTPGPVLKGFKVFTPMSWVPVICEAWQGNEGCVYGMVLEAEKARACAALPSKSAKVVLAICAPVELDSSLHGHEPRHFLQPSM